MSRMTKTGQKAAAQALMLTWKMVCLKHGHEAGKAFIDIYAKFGMGKAMDFKHLLDDEQLGIERTQALIEEVTKKLKAILEKEDEHEVLQ